MEVMSNSFGAWRLQTCVGKLLTCATERSTNQRAGARDILARCKIKDCLTKIRVLMIFVSYRTWLIINAKNYILLIIFDIILQYSFHIVKV